YPMGHAVRDFFANGGGQAVIVPVGGADGALLEDADYLGNADRRTGLHALRGVEQFNLLCIPPDVRDGSISPVVLQAALAVCVECRAMLIVDAPAHWRDVPSIVAGGAAALGIDGASARNAALYFPRLLQADPASGGALVAFAACGAIAGVMARTDTMRGVWKAPAGIDATLHVVHGLEIQVDDDDNGLLNPIAVNCLRTFPAHDPTVWGARTMAGRDALADEYKYVPVRRLALHIEVSVQRGTQWAAFEPNAEPLWAQLRASVDTFMHNLFRQGAFAGRTPRDAWFVRCDASTTTQDDINQGRVHIDIGFAAIKPAEFVVIRLTLAGGSVTNA
ncbi:MAG: phage tail sheath C-terminal domain-containing protein, partial [Luteimonas sp.]